MSLMVKLGRSYLCRSLLADSSMQSHPGDEKLEDSVDLEGCMLKNGDCRRSPVVAGSGNLLR